MSARIKQVPDREILSIPAYFVMTVVQLGFSEPAALDALGRLSLGHRSASYHNWDGGQVGGVPSWLDPDHLPTIIACDLCKDLMRFVAQLYAPVDDIHDGSDDGRAFHRTLYVFVCPECCKVKSSFTGAVKVLRCQLPQVNPYFPAEEVVPEESKDWKTHLPLHWKNQLCAVCGLKATKRCPLQNRMFCSQAHQKEYKARAHGTLASEDDELELSSSLPSLFPLSELVVEDEPPVPTDTPEPHAATSASNKPLFPCKANTGEDESDDSDQDLNQEDLNRIVLGEGKVASTTRDDVTERFFHRLHAPSNVQTQCLRYCRWNDEAVLWIQENHLPPFIPRCETCGAERKFEFQLMPQLLHYLQKGGGTPSSNLESMKDALRQSESWIQQAPPEQVSPALVQAKDDAVRRLQESLLTTQMDWGVIAVFTCTASCSRAGDDWHPELGAYQEEFAWKQPSLDADT